MTDALLHAQDYVDLAGEMPTQDAPPPAAAASSSEPEPPASSVPEKENPLIVNGVLKSYDTGKQKDVVLPSGKFTKIDSG